MRRAASGLYRPSPSSLSIVSAFSQFPLWEADHEESDSKANESDPRNEKWPIARKAEG